ncbi:unnamed protein product [Haemonchus placei]|uniref:C-type lectin domain-containing protein n=1 Tax=Haemonchus placei TaxID=6290 RepID=A0A0N4X439_HAEPC|nr:unnamed protein product [Haemonchus placei]
MDDGMGQSFAYEKHKNEMHPKEEEFEKLLMYSVIKNPISSLCRISVVMERLLQLFLGYLTVAVVSGITCVQLNGRNHCIHKGSHKWSWERSEAFCQSRRGHLTSIHDQKDIDAIKALAASEECKSFWTGGQCRSGKCSWVDGSSFDSKKFGEKRPNTSYQCIESSFEKGKGLNILPNS